MVDARTLTVGSHVKYDDVMVQVISILDDQNVWVKLSSGRKIACLTEYQYLEPIEISEKILRQAGFVRNRKDLTYRLNLGRGKNVYIDDWIYSKDDGGSVKWRVSIYSKDILCNNYLYTRWLHEVEAFVRMILGVELVKE